MDMMTEWKGNAMPLTDLLTPNKSSDAVSILNQTTFDQLFADARPIKVTVSPTAKLMEHPLETGATIIDHRIINPIEIELSLLVTSRSQLHDYRSVYAQLRQAFDAGDLVTVQTKAASYPNMVIYEIPHQEDADMFDAFSIALKLKEAKYVEARYATLKVGDVSKAQNSSTVARGEQQTTESTTDKSPSLLYEGYHKVFGP